jgi:hypothetical protein
VALAGGDFSLSASANIFHRRPPDFVSNVMAFHGNVQVQSTLNHVALHIAI